MQACYILGAVVHARLSVGKLFIEFGNFFLPRRRLSCLIIRQGYAVVASYQATYMHRHCGIGCTEYVFRNYVLTIQKKGAGTLIVDQIERKKLKEA
jgi:hypothetical protein